MHGDRQLSGQLGIRKEFISNEITEKKAAVRIRHIQASASCRGKGIITSSNRKCHRLKDRSCMAVLHEPGVVFYVLII